MIKSVETEVIRCLRCGGEGEWREVMHTSNYGFCRCAPGKEKLKRTTTTKLVSVPLWDDER